MRRLIALSVVAVIGFSACGSVDPSTSADTSVSTTAAPAPTDTAAPPDSAPTDTAAPTPTDTAPTDTAPTDTATPVTTQDQAELVRTWVLERFITIGPLDPVPDGVDVRIAFTPLGVVFVETGCNSGSGQVQFADDGSFSVRLALTEKACAGDVALVETRVVAQFEHPLLWSVDGDQLTLYPTDVSDTGMILHAA